MPGLAVVVSADVNADRKDLLDFVGIFLLFSMCSFKFYTHL
ncbi:MAG: hypothetical protein ACQUYJ_20430 [Ferruginibacter sp.]